MQRNYKMRMDSFCGLSFCYYTSYFHLPLELFSTRAIMLFKTQNSKRNSTLSLENFECLPTEAIWEAQFKASIGHHCRSLFSSGFFVGASVG